MFISEFFVQCMWVMNGIKGLYTVYIQVQYIVVIGGSIICHTTADNVLYLYNTNTVPI